ncbi:MAG: metallophosphoesterase [Candidatus Aenigmatarchaeota archaeon]
MHKIVSIADIHSETENILSFLLWISENEAFDCLVFNGDLLGSSDDSEFIAETILEMFKIVNKPIITIPGNNDGKIFDVFRKHSTFIHNNFFIFDNIAFFGYGGARTPIKSTSLEPSEKEFKVYLNSLYEKVKNVDIKVLVTHMPPKDTRLDLVSGSHVGSEEIRNFILKNKINLAICSHILEARGYDMLGNTLIINPGKFSEGNYALIGISTDGKIEFQLKNILQQKSSALDLWLKI